VLLCYGTYTNLELLEHYGFLLNENSNDKVFIPLEPEIFILQFMAKGVVVYSSKWKAILFPIAGSAIMGNSIK